MEHSSSSKRPKSCTGSDLISKLPDECLALIFQSLISHRDNNSCSLVCRRWLLVESQSRQCLSVEDKFESYFTPFVTDLFSRFDSVTRLVLRSNSLNDEDLKLISVECRNLTALKLVDTIWATDVGMASLGRIATRLKKFSCRTCWFGAKALNALLSQSSSLEVISIRKLYGIIDSDLIYPGAAASSLESICLKNIYDPACPWCFAPLITGSKNLRSLRLLRCYGDWDNMLNMLANRGNSLLEVCLDTVLASDALLSDLSNYLKFTVIK